MYKVITRISRTDRKILDALSHPMTWIVLGSDRRTNCQMQNSDGLMFRFQERVRQRLIDKGLILEDHSLTNLGIRALRRGWYPSP